MAEVRTSSSVIQMCLFRAHAARQPIPEIDRRHQIPELREELALFNACNKLPLRKKCKVSLDSGASSRIHKHIII